MSSVDIRPYYDEQGNLIIPHEFLADILANGSRESTSLAVALYKYFKSIKLAGEADGQVLVSLSDLLNKLQQQGLVGQDDLENEMLSIAGSSMDFWDNPVDDEVWNNA